MTGGEGLEGGNKTRPFLSLYPTEGCLGGPQVLIFNGAGGMSLSPKLQ